MAWVGILISSQPLKTPNADEALALRCGMVHTETIMEVENP